VDLPWVEVNTAVVAAMEPEVRLGKKLVERAFSASVCCRHRKDLVGQ
jgi:hypothetical protein